MKRRRLLKLLAITAIVIVLIIVGLYVFLSITTPVTKNLDSYVYTLPFQKGSKYKVIQGYGGLFSHKNIASLDFDMPEGSPVYAAREGVIYSYKDDSNEGGPLSEYKRKANYIMIKHDDGSFGCYWHLKKDGIVIKSGPVAKGQLIGYSGSTGFVFRPHLHFSVKRILNYDRDSFVRTKFETTNGIQLLENSKSYQRPLD